MAAKTMHSRWRATRDSLGETGDRPVETVCSARAPRAKVTADRSVTDTAAHVAAIASPYAPILRVGEHLDPAKPVTWPGGSQVPGFMP
ncbi:hypothetical protein [Streptosporangium roseum]|uniref:hypothetical protein n=1 Tax=Streptosporangium roseum TaxID=2001 RepID=UPI0018CC07EE|nr:hypothetical protein [Streptosporangium roseum]